MHLLRPNDFPCVVSFVRCVCVYVCVLFSMLFVIGVCAVFNVVIGVCAVFNVVIEVCSVLNAVIDVCAVFNRFCFKNCG